MVEEGCELSFNSSVYEIMNSFSQTTYSLREPVIETQ